MKVILVNGSPHRKGCTYTTLKDLAYNDLRTVS